MLAGADGRSRRARRRRDVVNGIVAELGGSVSDGAMVAVIRAVDLLAAETLTLIRNLRNAADWYVSSSIGPAPNFEPDFEIVDDSHVAEMCERIAAGSMLS